MQYFFGLPRHQGQRAKSWLAVLGGVGWALFGAEAAPVPASKLLGVAHRWVEHRASAWDQPRGLAPRVGTIEALPDAPEAPLLYHVALLPRGYLIIQADTRLAPVRAYSLTSDLNFGAVRQNALRAILKGDARLARAAIRKGLPPQPVNEQLWEELLQAADETVPLVKPPPPPEIIVSPLLGTTWNQNRHYNARCPLNPVNPTDYYDDRVPVGCAATAGAQLFNYFRWPLYGIGSHSYVDPGTIFGVRTAQFDDLYDWSHMLASYDPWNPELQVSVDAVAELMYELGVAVEMDYESGGSASFMSDVGTAAAKRFFYEEALFLVASDPTFYPAIEAELLAGHPVQVSLPGHAILLDGHKREAYADWYHVNYGWGGSNDGWYLPSDVTGSSIEDALIGMIPALVPLFDAPHGMTNGPELELGWNLPPSRATEAESVRLVERQLGLMDLSEPAEDFETFAGTSTYSTFDWTIGAAGHTGNAFFKSDSSYSGIPYSLTLASPVIPSATSRLTFWQRMYSFEGVLSAQISTDAGATFSDLWSISSTRTRLWSEVDLDLSSYAGGEILIRFEFVTARYYTGSDDGAWIDDIAITDVGGYSWIPMATGTVTGQSGTLQLTGLADGLHVFALQAGAGGAWHALSAPRSVSVIASPPIGDSDGMPDPWEVIHGLDPLIDDAAADLDEDGLSNWAEYIAGTEPDDSDSVFRVGHISREPNQTVIHFQTVTGRIYRVLCGETPAPLPWVALPTNVIGDGAEAHVYDQTPSAACFYRLDVDLAP